jgi:transposase
VSRQYGVSRSLIHNWRRQKAVSVLGATVRFSRVSVEPERRRGGTIEIELGGGVQVRVDGTVDEEALKRYCGAGPMIGLLAETRMWLASRPTDMRRGFDSLALVVQETLKRDPHCGHLFVVRGKRGGLINILWHDGQGMCLFANTWSAAASCGRAPKARRVRSRPHNSAICWNGSIGGCRSGPFVLRQRAELSMRRPMRHRDSAIATRALSLLRLHAGGRRDQRATDAECAVSP